MRTALTITYDKAGKATVVHAPDVPIDKQKADWRKLVAETKDGNDKIVVAQLWTSSGGLTKRQKWLSAAEVKAREAAREAEAKRINEESAAKAKADKAKADAESKELAAQEKSVREAELRQARERAEREKIDHPKK